MNISEKDFQSALLDIARVLGYRAYHTHDSRRSEPGFPDIVLVRGSRLIFAELKTDTGRTTTEQDGWLSALQGTSAEVYVWRPKQMQDIIPLLRRKEAP